MGLNPIFVVKKEGKILGVLPLITKDEKKYDPISVIKTLAKSVKPIAKNLMKEDLGLLTFAVYTLAETLHLIGLADQANKLFIQAEDSLVSAAWYCALGIEIGRRLPKGLKIGSEETEDSARIWEGS